MFYAVRKSGDPVQNPWLAMHQGQAIFGPVLDLLACGAEVKIFRRAAQAHEFVKNMLPGTHQTTQLYRAEESPEGIKFTPEPWPA